MNLDFDTVSALREHNSAWQLLRADHAPLIASFLYRAFMAKNVRVMSADDLTSALNDELYVLRSRLGEDAFPKSAQEYLNDWASPDKEWLRKFYRPGTDEPQFDITSATEKAITWLGKLTEQEFVGTESRLLMLFDLLKQIHEGSEADPAKRMEELQKRRDEIDAEMARVVAGDVDVLNATAIKERFQQFMQGGRDLLSDFREVEQNFRRLDKNIREKIAKWDKGKGGLLDYVFDEKDAIANSDQGKSFRAFRDFLKSSRRQEELTLLIDRILALPAVKEMNPDARIRYLHYDWLDAGQQTQSTVAMLSKQLNKFLDDRNSIENRRIMELLRGIEIRALELRGREPTGYVMEIPQLSATIELPMELKLFKPTLKTVLSPIEMGVPAEEIDSSSLFNQVIVDLKRIERNIRETLKQTQQVTLLDLVSCQPLEHGLAEIVAYLQMGLESFSVIKDENVDEPIHWMATDLQGNRVTRSAHLPRMLFTQPKSGNSQ